MRKLIFVLLGLVTGGFLYAGTISNEYVSFTYPDKWEMVSNYYVNAKNKKENSNESSNVSVSYSIKAKNTDGEEIVYTKEDERLNIVFDISEGENFAIIVTINKGQSLSQTMESGLWSAPLKEEKIKIAGTDGIKLIGEMPMFEMKFCTIGYIKNNLIYKISYTAPIEKYNPEIENEMTAVK